jgi:spire-like protein
LVKSFIEHLSFSSTVQLVQSLGVVVFRALDYGLSDAEEQRLSVPLEELLERMTASADADANAEADDGEDEGIEGDASPVEGDARFTLSNVIQVG